MSVGSILYPIFYIDSPKILQANVTPIPGSGSLPLQVIAISPTNLVSYGVTYIDTTGDFIGVYTGSVGSEIIRAIVGGGLVSSTPLVIPANSRVSLRSMTASPITNGYLTLTFLGYGWNGIGG